MTDRSTSARARVSCWSFRGRCTRSHSSLVISKSSMSFSTSTPAFAATKPSSRSQSALDRHSDWKWLQTSARVCPPSGPFDAPAPRRTPTFSRRSTAAKCASRPSRVSHWLPRRAQIDLSLGAVGGDAGVNGVISSQSLVRDLCYLRRTLSNLTYRSGFSGQECHSFEGGAYLQSCHERRSMDTA